MKYLVKVKEVSFGSIAVEAESLDEVKEKAEQAYLEGNTFWKESDMEIVHIQQE